jgi:hypothetical protein
LLPSRFGRWFFLRASYCFCRCFIHATAQTLRRSLVQNIYSICAEFTPFKEERFALGGDAPLARE